MLARRRSALLALLALVGVYVLYARTVAAPALTGPSSNIPLPEQVTRAPPGAGPGVDGLPPAVGQTPVPVRPVPSRPPTPVPNNQPGGQGGQDVASPDGATGFISGGPDEAQARAAVELFNKKITALQFPADCKTRKFIRCGLGAGSSCGFGCQFHHFVYCLIAGMATDRTVVLDIRDWRYASTSRNCTAGDPWGCFFEPTSACTVADLQGRAETSFAGAFASITTDVVDLGFRSSREYDKWVPEDLKALLAFHKRPQLWLVGHASAFLLRFNARLRAAYAETKAAIGFKHPILGVHARGDDKYQEAAIHYLSEYLQYAPRFERVFLATDDQRNIDEMAAHPNITFLRLSGAVAGAGNRYADGALVNLLFDVMLLSECDHFIGTDGSQISRLVYELQQTRHPNGFDKGWSIDTIIKDKVNAFFWYLI
eukprot:m.12204 g.12204  ORF g.12204 m.12204 type:complete len:427 (+) comp2707_c0_seq1:41-1321(+)